MKNEQPYSWAGDAALVRQMLLLALPVLAEESLNLLVGITDRWLVGHCLPGAAPQAAMTLIAYVLWTVPSFFAFVGVGATAVVARLIGAGDRAGAEHVARQSLLLGAGFALVAYWAMIYGGPAFIALMQVRGEAAELAARFLSIIAPVAFCMMFEQVATACLRGAGDTVSGLVARVVLNIVNFGVSVVLVNGWGLSQPLGWDGLAYGVLLGHLAGAATLFVLIVWGKSGLKNLFSTPQADLQTLRRILRVGVPGGMDLNAVLGCHLVYLSIINSLGPLAQSAHGLGLQIEAMSFLAGAAFQAAATTMAGQALGAGDERRAIRGVLTSCVGGVAIMTTAGLFFFFYGEGLAGLFVSEPGETTVLVGRLLKIVALSCPFLAVLMVFSGALRGSGDTSWPLVITFVGLLGVRIPLAALLAWNSVELFGVRIPGLGWGVEGAWIAMVSDVVLRSALISVRFFRGRWRKTQV